MRSLGQRVGYIRVSTAEQSTGRQLNGETLDRTFIDKASGKDRQRPALSQAIIYVRDGDTLVVHSIDRLARNLLDLRRIVEEVVAKGARVQFIKEAQVFSGEGTASATFLLNIMGAFAEFERALIRERQREGIVLAKARGVYKGRKRAMTPEQMAEICAKAAGGSKKTALAREYKVSSETVHRVLRSREWIGPLAQCSRGLSANAVRLIGADLVSVQR